jgi:cupin 2 domain-containing protein
LLKNIFNYHVPQSGEDFTTLLQHKNVCINRIVSSDKVEKKLYIQDEDEWLVVLKGSATLEIDGKIFQLSCGDTLFISAKTPHKILSTAKGTLWLTVHIFTKIEGECAIF